MAVGPRDRVSQVESPGVAPGSPACGAGVVLLDHDPNVSLQRKPWGSNPQAARLPPPAFQAGSSTIRMASVIIHAKAEAVGLELTSGFRPPPVFRTGSSSGRMASVVELRRLESNQHEDVQSVSSCRWMTPHRCYLARHDSSAASSGRRGRTSVAWFKARGPTASRSPIRFQSALRESNPPRQLGRLEPKPFGQGRRKAEGEGVEPSRLIARPLSRRLPSPIDLTFRIQSSGRRDRTSIPCLTGPGRLPLSDAGSKSGWPDLNRRSRVPETRGIPGFPTSCCAKRPSGSRTRTSAMARQLPPQAHHCFDLAMLCGISPGFPELFPTRGQVVTCYSPGRHFTHGLLHFLVRLACVRHAASVDSEPGSNSRLKPEICSERTNSPSTRKSTAYFVSTFRLLARTFPSHPAGNRNLRTDVFA